MGELVFHERITECVLRKALYLDMLSSGPLCELIQRAKIVEPDMLKSLLFEITFTIMASSQFNESTYREWLDRVQYELPFDPSDHDNV